MAIKVTLREKLISKGRKSLYLDIYPPVPNLKTGELTRREFLGLYIFVKPKNITEKQSNKERCLFAEQIRLKREIEFNKPEIYSGYEKEQLKIKERGQQNFVEYFESLANKRKASNHDNWMSALNYLKEFTHGFVRFDEVTEKFCDDFKHFLLNAKSNKGHAVKLSQNSASSYFNKLKAALKQAYKEDYLPNDLNSKIRCIDSVEVLKNTLTLEELNRIAKVDFENNLCKRVVLFSAMTGIPFMELRNMKWGNIDFSETFGYRIKIIRKKTSKPYYVNISQQSYELIGDRKNPDEYVFLGLSNIERYTDFPLLLAKAGINKKMTFHDLRHTYGTLQIELGTDIYTLQGNMNHAAIRQTMMYAKISDRRKRDAADRIKLDL